MNATKSIGSGFKTRPWTRAGRLIAACALGLSMAGLAPEPDPVPRRWQLEIEPGPLRMATFNLGEQGPRRFFYMTYRVINNSGQELLFAPAFDLADGEGEVIRSGRDVPGAVTSALLEQARNPFIQDQISIIGEIRQGAENAKDGLVVWPAATLRPQEITVYIGGLSGETATVTSPDGKSRFVLRKTLKLDYASPGDLTAQGADAFTVQSRAWIMR
jgi:hypothetical protein